MADLSANAPKRLSKPRSFEFTLYFGLIFICAIPFGFIFWIKNMIQQRTLNLHGPLALAWREADRITPLIFSA